MPATTQLAAAAAAPAPGNGDDSGPLVCPPFRTHAHQSKTSRAGAKPATLACPPQHPPVSVRSCTHPAQPWPSPGWWPPLRSLSPRRAHRFLCPAASGPRALVLAPLAAARRAAAEDDGEGAALRAVAERAARKQSERRTYLVAAVMSSLGITSMAAAAAHQIHHMDKFQGVPYGLFLGPKELKEVGGTEELEKEINKRVKRKGTLDAIQ